jgi:hypothetical protein
MDVNENTRYYSTLHLDTIYSNDFIYTYICIMKKPKHNVNKLTFHHKQNNGMCIREILL